MLVVKYVGHHREPFHGLIHFKKAFDRVWHDSLWRVLKEFNIDNRLIDVVNMALYDEATSEVVVNGNVGDFFER